MIVKDDRNKIVFFSNEYVFWKALNAGTHNLNEINYEDELRCYPDRKELMLGQKLTKSIG